MIDYSDTSAVKRLVLHTKAKHITLRVLAVLDDYYRDSGVEILAEIDLPEMITAEIQTCLDDLKEV